LSPARAHQPAWLTSEQPWSSVQPRTTSAFAGWTAATDGAVRASARRGKATGADVLGEIARSLPVRLAASTPRCWLHLPPGRESGRQTASADRRSRTAGRQTETRKALRGRALRLRLKPGRSAGDCSAPDGRRRGELGAHVVAVSGRVGCREDLAVGL